MVSVVWVVTVVGKGKVFGDLWDVWLRIDVEEEENEVVLHDDEEVVCDGNVQVIEGSVIFGSWIGVFAVVMSTNVEWVPVESRQYCDPELQVQWVWPSGQVEALV